MRGAERFFAGLSSLLRAKREPENHQRFRRAGSTRKGLLALFRPQSGSRSPKMLAASLNAFFCASPIYGSAEDFTYLLDVTVSRDVTPAAKQQIGETRKKRLAQRLAFFRFDNSSGIIKGEQPLIRASRASKVAGTFLVLFWCAKENLTPRDSALYLYYTPNPPDFYDQVPKASIFRPSATLQGRASVLYFL